VISALKELRAACWCADHGRLMMHDSMLDSACGVQF